MSKKIPKNIKFESALSELEKQVELLESGDLPLDESLEAFQYGTELSRICLSKLSTAKAAVEKLVVPEDNEEAYRTEHFATTEDDTMDAAADDDEETTLVEAEAEDEDGF